MELDKSLDKCLDDIGAKLSRIVDRAWQRDMPQTSTEIIGLLRVLPAYSRQEKQRIYDAFCDVWNSGSSEPKKGNGAGNLTASTSPDLTQDINGNTITAYQAEIARLQGILEGWDRWYDQMAKIIAEGDAYFETESENKTPKRVIK